jgi:hypothetical protein
LLLQWVERPGFNVALGALRIYCPKVLVISLVSGVGDKPHVECSGQSHEFGERVDLHLPHDPPPMSL